MTHLSALLVAAAAFGLLFGLLHALDRGPRKE
jgi:hypothetical protein